MANVPSTGESIDHRVASRSLVSDSAALGFGTALSRGSGVLRMLAIAAVFGPTVIGDMFLAVNVLPLTVFAAFGGQAITSLLVPVLVRKLADDPERSDALARNALGVVIVALSALALLGVALHRPIAALLASGLDAATGGDAEGVAAVLVLFILPQVVLYGVVSVFVAVQHAHKRFVLPSLAPTLENIGLIATVLMVTRVFDDVHLSTASDTNVLIFLGIGSTISLVAHVAIQAWGVHRCGVSIRPSLPRRDPELMSLRGQVSGNLAWTLLGGARSIALVVAAGYAGAGGIQAIEIGILLYNLPNALIGYPLAAAILPRLSHNREGSRAIADGYAGATRLATWILLAVGGAMIALSHPLSEALAVGRFGEGDGAMMIRYGAIGLAIGAVADAFYEMARQATMAYGDLRGFSASIWTRAVICLIGIPLAPFYFDGPELLLALGVVVSLSDLAAFAVIDRSLRRTIVGSSASRRTAVGAISATLVASLLAWFVSGIGLIDDLSNFVALAVGAVVFAVVYLAIAFVASDRGGLIRSTYASVNSAVTA